MHKTTVNKVICYVTNEENKLLVFRHTDYSFEEVSIQVPAGTMRLDEAPEQAALREAREETGLEGFDSVRFLGTADFDISPTRFEIQHRHFFHLRFNGETPERWATQEMHDGLREPTNFECFWIDLEKAHVLQSGQSAMVWMIANPYPYPCTTFSPA